ncbi:MAG: hypothetical protein C0632_16790, partial [Vibrio alginolyticus]
NRRKREHRKIRNKEKTNAIRVCRFHSLWSPSGQFIYVVFLDKNVAIVKLLLSKFEHDVT